MIVILTPDNYRHLVQASRSIQRITQLLYAYFPLESLVFWIEKARNGAVIVVLEILGKLTLPQLITIIACALIVAGIATYLALFFAKIFSRIIEKVNYTYLSVGIILLIITLVFVFCGFIGLFVLAVSTCLGLVPIYLGIGKNHSMGCLLIPVILFFIV